MQAGKLRHRVIPQKSVSVQDPLTGEVVKNWVNLVQSTADNGIWAEYIPFPPGNLHRHRQPRTRLLPGSQSVSETILLLNAAFYIEGRFSTLRGYFPILIAVWSI